MAFFRRKQPKIKANEATQRDTLRSAPERLPRHVAIIMDGNGRWAQARGLPRIEGHRQGAQSVRKALEACGELGIPFLSLYCFSNENWKRPAAELEFLMELLKNYLSEQSETLVKNGIRLLVIGRREGLASDVLEIIDRAIEISKAGNKLTLCLAINYGSRQEIVDAVRAIAAQVRDGQCQIDAIDETRIADSLYTHGLPDPDLVIRTSGEMRLSNFLLWQISYSELWVTEKRWPEFGKADLFEAVAQFAKRDRRFGGIDAPNQPSP